MKNSKIELKEQYLKHKSKIQKRLRDFKSVPESEYFYELCFCLLTPQSNAHKCWEAIEDLKKVDFLNADVDPLKHVHRRARFHNHKSGYLLEFKQKHKKLFFELSKIKDNKTKREFLVSNVKGMGLKEASHFLRNVGHRELAILDRHILKNMEYYGAIKSLPKSLTKTNYLALEKKFEKFCNEMGIPLDEMDLLFWSKEAGDIFK